MTDFYLKFENKEQADSVLYTKVPTAWGEKYTLDGGPIPTEFEDKPNFANIDVIGTIYRPTEEVDEEGNPVMEALTGYHINIRAVDGEDTSAIAPFAVVPSVPVRVWG